MEEIKDTNNITEKGSTSNSQGSLNTNLKFIISLIPLLSLFLILVGFFYASGYYEYYGIVIQRYLSFSEIPALFFSAIFNNVLILIILSIFCISMIMFLNQADRPQFVLMRKVGFPIKFIRPKNQIFNYLYRNQNTIIWVFNISFFIFTFLIIIFPYHSLSFIYSITLLVFTFLNIFKFQNASFENNILFKRAITLVMVFFLIIFFFSFVKSQGTDDAASHQKFATKEIYPKFNIVLKDSTVFKLRKDKKYMYLGKTNSFYFLYNVSDSIAVAILNDQVALIEFKNIPPF